MTGASQEFGGNLVYNPDLPVDSPQYLDYWQAASQVRVAGHIAESLGYMSRRDLHDMLRDFQSCATPQEVFSKAERIPVLHRPSRTEGQSCMEAAYDVAKGYRELRENG